MTQVPCFALSVYLLLMKNSEDSLLYSIEDFSESRKYYIDLLHFLLSPSALFALRSRVFLKPLMFF